MAEIVNFPLPVSPDVEPVTQTEQELLAARVREALNVAAELIPRLEWPHPAARTRSQRTLRNEQIADLIAIVKEDEILRELTTFDIDEARETLQFNDAFRSVAAQLEMLMKALRFTMEARKARVVKAALSTYAVAQALARSRDAHGARLAARLEGLRKVMRESRAHRTKKTTE